MQDVLTANAVIIGTTENFGYMSGLIKDFFERIYYPCLEKTQALPWALYVRAGKDGAGALRAVCAIAVGLKWRAVQEPLLLHGNHKTGIYRPMRNPRLNHGRRSGSGTVLKIIDGHTSLLKKKLKVFLSIRAFLL